MSSLENSYVVQVRLGQTSRFTWKDSSHHNTYEDACKAANARYYENRYSYRHSFRVIKREETRMDWRYKHEPVTDRSTQDD